VKKDFEMFVLAGFLGLVGFAFLGYAAFGTPSPTPSATPGLVAVDIATNDAPSITPLASDPLVSANGSIVPISPRSVASPQVAFGGMSLYRASAYTPQATDT
jgi:hypothetical protein